MPEFPIVDAHVHLYDTAVLDFPWMERLAQIRGPHLPADYDARTAPVAVERMVFLEVDVAAGRHVDEARWVADLAAREPRLAGMVASAPLEHGAKAVEADLAAIAALPPARGIRRLIQGHVEEPGWCLRPDFVEAVRLLPEHGLTFDICIYHPQMADAIELVRRCPEVSFILDHIGKPAIRDRLREPWWSQMRELAALPNVICKVSGAVTEADRAAWTYDDVAPYVAHAVECFGFDRVAFGGDWPVVELAARYADWVAVLDRVVAGASEADRRKLYRDNAIRFYRL